MPLGQGTGGCPKTIAGQWYYETSDVGYTGILEDQDLTLTLSPPASKS